MCFSRGKHALQGIARRSHAVALPFLNRRSRLKVHKCYLLREPCVFGDMFSLPFVKGSNEGLPDEPAIPLFEQFRDLLWALYAV